MTTTKRGREIFKTAIVAKIMDEGWESISIERVPMVKKGEINPFALIN